MMYGASYKAILRIMNVLPTLCPNVPNILVLMVAFSKDYYYAATHGGGFCMFGTGM